VDLPKACLFDLDDTILADNAMSDVCWREACEEWVSRNPGTDPGIDPGVLACSILEARDSFFSDQEKLRWLSLNLPESRAQVVLKAFAGLGIDYPESALPLALRFDSIKIARIELFPGAIDTLRHLQRNGQKLALITNGTGRLQKEKIVRFNLEPLFDCIVIEGAYGIGKPDRRVFDFALDELGVSAVDAWMIGDSLVNDIAGAQAAGVYAIWVDWGKTGLPKTGIPGKSAAVPDRIIHSIAELAAGD